MILGSIGFRISGFQGFRVLGFQRSRVLGFQGFRVCLSFRVFLGFGGIRVFTLFPCGANDPRLNKF
jgi:hypothetical protein